MNLSLMQKISIKYILIILYNFILLSSVYFYEVSRANDKNSPNCGTGYLIFGLPFIMVGLAIFISLIISIKNKKDKKKNYIDLIFILVPLMVWLYFYGELLLFILSIFLDGR
jgi:hypothetical protein